MNPQILADSLPFDALWRDAVPVVRLGPGARMPSLVGSIVLASIHRLAHHQQQERLIWLYDVRLLATLLNDADWQKR